MDDNTNFPTAEFAESTLTFQQFHMALFNWWQQHQRSYPWRETTNPFHLLLSELMLRRTKADQVEKIYIKFVEKYPDPLSLSIADPAIVADDLYSLGLSWRIPSFQQLARKLINEYGGLVPPDYHELKKLPGVGDYVASAVCSFSFRQPIAIIDTNTVRVTGRLFGFPTHAESRRRKPVQNLINSLIDPNHPRQYNYAMLDLAALICRSRNPQCVACPLLRFCKTGQKSVLESD